MCATCDVHILRGNNLPHYVLKARWWMRFIIMQRADEKRAARRSFLHKQVIKVQSQINSLAFFAYYSPYCIKCNIKFALSCISVMISRPHNFLHLWLQLSSNSYVLDRIQKIWIIDGRKKYEECHFISYLKNHFKKNDYMEFKSQFLIKHFK